LQPLSALLRQIGSKVRCDPSCILIAADFLARPTSFGGYPIATIHAGTFTGKELAMRNRVYTIAMTIMSIFILSTGAHATSRQTGQRPTEAEYEEKLIREVHHQLVLLPFYSVFDNLEYSVQGNTVTLSGQVVLPVLKSDAEAAVKKIEGVAQVVNNIEVLPLSPNDDRLRRALYRRIFGDSVLQRYALQAVPPIHIIVKGGHVTLVGIVATEMDKNVTGIRANGVAGVLSVNNKLQVEGKKS
jgi:hyperosmotically inducible protein